MSRIVVVDDQSANRMVLSRLAATLEADTKVEAFADPIQALTNLESQTPDLLITDFQMPTINGAELIRRFRTISACRDVPAVVVTAHEDVTLRAIALEAGANDFIMSPLNHDEFRSQSRKLLEMRRSSLVTAVSGSQSVYAVHDGAGARIELLNSLVENLGAKLVSRTGRIAQLSAEMQILLEASNAATIFIDPSCHIQNYNDRASEIYYLSQQDRGKSLCQLQCKLTYDNLAIDFRQMLESGLTVERYLQSATGRRHYRLRLVPIWDLDELQGGLLIFIPIPAWHERSRFASVH